MQVLNTLWRSWVVLAAMVLSPLLFGQAGDFDLEIRLDQEGDYRPGGRVTATPGMVARAGGTQGWSFGIRHDPAVLRAATVTMKGSDAEAAGAVDEHVEVLRSVLLLQEQQLGDDRIGNGVRDL